ncbi:MAG: tetratricopeptide repeat protein [Candidatus Cloacimonetes bacterium]|nr:tetratricopeptide repeat protein [Candidatus Cloacimonadota bacterium]
MSLLKSDRCKHCKTHRGYRFCQRIGGGICWHDCNVLRVDFGCPEGCKYSLKKTEQFQLKTNADSQTEYRDLLRRQMNIWIETPQELLDGDVPADLAETPEGRRRLQTLLDGFPGSDVVPMAYLYKKLRLDASKLMAAAKNPEDVAVLFVKKCIVQDWDGAMELLSLAPHLQDPVYQTRYREMLANNKTIARFKEYDIISSAMSEEKNRILVHFEMNGKYDLTIGLVLVDGQWLVAGKILGKPEIYNGENEAIQQVALMLSKNDLGNVFPLLKKYSEIYVDSADFQYYWGLYYTFSHQEKKARMFMLNASTLDPTFVEALYNYAYMLHAAGELDEAETRYRKILSIDPEEPKTLNNLASICMEDKRLDEARELYKKCLALRPDFEIAQKNLEKLEELEN